MNNDLLTSEEYGLGARNSDISTMETTNLLLQALIREIRKAHPSKLCVTDVQYNNAKKIIDSSADHVTVRFLDQGKPVKSQYLLITNGTPLSIAVGLNMPAVIDSTAAAGGPLTIKTFSYFQIPVEIEFVDITVFSNTTGQNIHINNNPSGLGVNGVIGVYGWTVPNSDKDQTE